jgi:predicted nuclease of predicted toxin-antitoxin system
VKFKLDENLPTDLVPDIQALGHDVDTVFDEGLNGEPDPEVLDGASKDSRILLTLDKGFANLVIYPINTHSGIVLFRPESTGRRSVIEFIRERLSLLVTLSLTGRLTIVSPTKIRTR